LGADVALKNRDGQDACAVTADEGNEELAQHLRRLRAGRHIPVDKDSACAHNYIGNVLIQNPLFLPEILNPKRREGSCC